MLCIAIAVLPFYASAHHPIFESSSAVNYSTAQNISDPDISWAVYGFLDAPDDIDYYYFDIAGPFTLTTGIDVIKNDVYASFRPTYAIIGPGITSNTDSVKFSVPQGMGAIVVNESLQEPRNDFYEPFGGYTYNQSAMRYTNLTVPGRYYILVYDEEHRKGDYVLVVGTREYFSLVEIPGILLDVIKIRLGYTDHSAQLKGQ